VVGLQVVLVLLSVLPLLVEVEVADWVLVVLFYLDVLLPAVGHVLLVRIILTEPIRVLRVS
jgi:hypothetical protein